MHQLLFIPPSEPDEQSFVAKQCMRPAVLTPVNGPR